MLGLLFLSIRKKCKKIMPVPCIWGFFLDNFTSFLILYCICSTILFCFFYLSKQESHKREKFALNKTVQRFTERRVLIGKKNNPRQRIT